MHRITAPWTTSLLLATLGLPATLDAQEGHPNLSVGVSPTSSYTGGEIDAISNFNGGLSIAIPIGPRYAVSSSLSYGLTAQYSNQIWDFREITEDGQTYVEARPSRGFNAGVGWTIGFGELWHPGFPKNFTGEWLWLSPDGGSHRFYQQMHTVSGEDDGDLNVLYSRDGSSIRFVKVSDWEVWIETPDGLRRKYVKPGGRFLLTRIEDPFDNWVAIAYPDGENQWDITDMHGRTHHVYLFDAGISGPTIDSIDFEGPNGQRLLWTFDHAVVPRRRSCKDSYPENNDRPNLALLTRITRPDTSKFEMLEGGSPAYWDDGLDGCDGGMYDRPGMLKRITLPTGGSIRYDYQRYDFPGGGHPPDYYQSATGVWTRKTYDRDGTPIGTTTYHTIRYVTTNEKEMETRVVHPTGACSLHFFEANPDPHTTTGEGWDYGLPYTDRFNSGGRNLSSEIWTSHDANGCAGTKLRSTYVLFDHDPLPNLGDDPSNWYNTNRRFLATRTMFHDIGDEYIDTAFSEIGYDGVGHYRTATTTSTITFTNDRIVTTNFNPGRSPWTPWPVGDPWILGTFSSTRVEEPGAVGETTARVDYQFDTDTGALTCQRVLKSGNSRSGADLVTQYTRSGAGNVTQVRTRGGDGAGLPTGSLCAGSGGAGANFTYAHGVAKTTRPIGTNGAVLGYFTYDADIDPGSGWVMAARDPSGLQTSYTYDALGRVKTVTPQEGASSSTTYTPGTGSSPAKIRTKVMGAGMTLSDSEVIFDGLGRTVESRRQTPDHGWVSTYTTYDASGRVLSQTLPNDPTKTVRYMSYDPLGRPGIIRPPEGSGHDVLMTYSGPYNYTRSVKVGKAEGKVYETWRYAHDGYGRLQIVTEPGADVGQETGETLRAGYAYDVAGRLTLVRTVDGANGLEQRREFLYDNRGFLLSETHPELGAEGGSGGFTYAGYDAFGNPGRVTNNARDLRYVYDAFRRLAEVRDRLRDDRFVKRFVYDTALGRGEGKLAQAYGYNYINLQGEGEREVLVTELYRYEGPAGALSSRTTLVSRDSLQFEEQYVYDAAGQLTGLSYPSCPYVGCDEWLPGRTVDFTYSLGHLRWVGGYTSGPITYHPDSSWSTVPHSNGVTDQRFLNNGNPSRTGWLNTTGASSNYGSGSFQYDGAGHIIEMGDRAFVYDAVGRFEGTGTKVGGDWQTGLDIDWEWRYEYDAYGNLKQHRRDFPDGTHQTRTFAMDVQKNQLASGGYDTAGNLTSWGGSFYGYDAAGNVRLQAATGGIRYHLYTASDERIGTLYDQGASSPVEETYTLRSAGGQVLREVARDDTMSPGRVNWIRDYVWRGGQLLAAVQPGQDNEFKRHYTLNHLGSPVLVTSWDAQSVASYAEATFGEDVSDISNPDLASFPIRFTGHERDFHGVGTLDDLDYMHARHYTPYVGRFLQVDPVLGSTGSPQSWNRYAYTGNDPVNFTDPTGMQLSDGSSCTHDSFGNYVSGDCGHSSPASGGGGGGIPDSVRRMMLEMALNSFGFGGVGEIGSDEFGWGAIGGAVVSAAKQAAGAVDATLDAVDKLTRPEGCVTVKDQTICGDDVKLGIMPMGPGKGAINVTQKGLKHVLERHVVGGVLADPAKKSIFNVGEDVAALISRASSASPTVQSGGRLVFTTNAGRAVGVDITTGQGTSVYTVITEANGDLVTAFPGLP